QELLKRLIRAGCPGGFILLRAVVQHELEELHERALRLGRDLRVGEDGLAGRGDAGQQGRTAVRGGTVDEEGADGEELELPEGAGGHELREEARAGVDDLWGEGEGVGPRERETLILR